MRFYLHFGRERMEGSNGGDGNNDDKDNNEDNNDDGDDDDGEMTTEKITTEKIIIETKSRTIQKFGCVNRAAKTVLHVGTAL